MMNYMAIPGLKFRTKKVPARGFVNSERIISITLFHFNVSFKEVMRKSRYANLVYPKHVLMYLLFKNTNNTYSELAKMFSFDRTSIMHAVKSITDRMETDEMVRIEVSELEDAI